MYLMNVPPVAATRTEWRPRGPRAGFSLPICFNDSDVALSTQGTPISDKVQMIIESLRSSQSSLEMGDEMEGNAQCRQEGHPKVCKVMGSYMEVKAKGKSPSETHLADVSSSVHHRSSDSDSDDSVDRGIEEAILEYLKERDDHKRKAEPCGTFLQTKIPRKCPPVPEFSKQSTDSSTRVISGSHFPRSVKAETATAPLVLPTKKHLKNNYLNDKMQKKLDSNKTASLKSLVLPKQQIKCPPKAFSIFNKIKCPVAVQMEEDSNDSSSDDGIEEAIQRYQLEKNEQDSKRKKSNKQQLKEESDSTSDDGIEEAIRHYQLEQLKEKSEGVPKPAPHKQKPSKSLIHSIEGASVEHARRNRLRRKKSRAETERQSAPAAASHDFTPRGSLSDRSNSNGKAVSLSQEEGFKERLALTSANTTAELMCAEAILDISKTVMPEAFSVGLAAASVHPSLPDDPAEDDASSVDSEDGIEQEIRRFLEQKAQLHRQPPGFAVTREPPSGNEPAEVKTKATVIQKKPSRLSLTHRRIHKEESGGKFNISGTDVTAAAPKLSPERRKEPNSSQLCQRREQRAIAGGRQAEQSGDKSSSLDSDEDLDTAIKDLLKTKKKSKKKARDSKWRSRQSLKVEGPNFRCTSQTEKLKFDTVSKCGAFKRGKKLKEEVGISHTSAKLSVQQHKRASKNDGCDGSLEKQKVAERREALLRRSNTAPPLKDDSSSVDSDDSIEQEIRRFLAEKAKVSTPEKGKDEDVSNGSAVVCGPITEEGNKRENQLAEVPTLSFSLCAEPCLLNRRPVTSPESLQPVISADDVQSGLTSAQSSSPGLLEPADGAGATRPMNVTRTEKGWPSLSPKNALSCSQSTKWRQCLGLPTTDSQTFNQASFYITSSKSSATAPATPATPSRIVTPKLQTASAVWSTVKTSRASFSCSRETSVYTTFQTPLSNRFPATRQQPSLTPRLTLGHHSQCPVEGEAASMVHVPKDKTVFVELETNRTNHVQVRSRDRGDNRVRAALPCEVKREEGSLAMDEKEVHLERAEEFIDEPDCESDQRNPEKQQGFPPLSLSSAIDPGISISPCIALTTEERSNMLSRRCLAEKCTQVLRSFSTVQNKPVWHVKRKLQFIPVNRRNDTSGLL
ncbi:protein phosphatase 1 regulatory subunit 26 [Takifugu rubripes]|nr:protein phosphatase 1 regulatory subunit 26 [Takifugu rubripes]